MIFLERLDTKGFSSLAKIEGKYARQNRNLLHDEEQFKDIVQAINNMFLSMFTAGIHHSPPNLLLY